MSPHGINYISAGKYLTEGGRIRDSSPGRYDLLQLLPYVTGISRFFLPELHYRPVRGLAGLSLALAFQRIMDWIWQYQRNQCLPRIQGLWCCLSETRKLVQFCSWSELRNGSRNSSTICHFYFWQYICQELNLRIMPPRSENIIFTKHWRRFVYLI